MKRGAIFLLLGFMLALSACGTKNEDEKIEIVENRENQNVRNGAEEPDSIVINEQSENETLVNETIGTNEENAALENGDGSSTFSEELSFEYLSDYEFEFSSGAGAWSTNFTIESDGYFKGTYHDSDMGDTNEYYPDGTMYYCDFTGHFKDLQAIEPYKYEMTLADIKYKNEIDDEAIFDGVRYIYTDAYGLTGTDKFYVCLPGYSVASFDEEIFSWVAGINDNEDVLTVPVIVNINENEGIYGRTRTAVVDDAKMTYDNYNKSYNYYAELLQKDNTQLEYNNLAKRQFEIADEALTYLWDLVKYHTDETGFQTILAEQRRWNADKEAAANEEKAKYEGGSMAPLVYYMTLADWTNERCKVLYEYIIDNAD